MRRGRKLEPVELNEEQLVQLESFANSRALAHAQVMRAKIVLMAADGVSNLDIATALGLNRLTVAKWRDRFITFGVEGLYDEIRAGRPRTIDDERIAELINMTLQRKPEGETHWSCRTMAAER